MNDGQTDSTIDDAVRLLRDRFGIAADRPPAAAIILGSGLGGLADRIESPIAVPFADIPGFRGSTAGGHRGELIYGEFGGKPVVAMAGRFHRYEGWSNAEVALPVLIIAALGAGVLVVSNAAGGVSPRLNVGDIVIIRDHLDWMHGPRIGAGPSEADSNDPPVGSRSPARIGNTYDDDFVAIAMSVAASKNFAATAGTYLATLGPTYETRAEYRMMRTIGVDVAGMSTVPEVLAARAAGMRVLGLSMVSNVARPDRPESTDHDEVLAAGAAAADKMESIVAAVVERCGPALRRPIDIPNAD